MIVNGFNLALHTQVALTVTLGANDTDRRLMNQLHVGAEFTCDAIGLRVATRVAIKNDGFRFFAHRVS